MVHTKNTKKLILSLFSLFIFAACTGKKETANSEPKILRVLTWSEYFQDSIVQDFEKANNVKVVRDLFSSNEELLSKIQASVQSGSTGYDLILPSDYMVEAMIELKLLKEIDKAQLGFLKDLDPAYLKPSYDPELKYSVPFAIGTTGIAVNTKLLPGISTLSWKEIYENPKFVGQVSLLNDSKEVLHTALLAIGKDWLSAGEKEIKEAFAYLSKHKKNIKIFAEEAKSVIANNECGLCLAYSGDVLSVAATNKDIQYLIPREGGTLWADNFAIPANAVNVELAHKFVSFMLSADTARAFTARTHYPTPNLLAKTGLPEELLKNQNIFLTPDVLKTVKFLKNKTAELPLIDKLWTELRSSN